MKTFELPKKVPLANLPTPIQPLKALSALFAGPEIFMKRDDLTGMEMTGNKVRKLEYVVADAMRKGAEVLITCGGVQSNHARATAFTAAKTGMQRHLVLRAGNSRTIDGNLFLDLLVDAEITFITAEEYERVDEIMQEIAEKYKADGKRAYVVPEGASNAIGAMGYVEATQEILRQSQQMGVDFDAVISAVGSGGTYAGLLLGKRIYGADWQVLGVNVCNDAPYFVQRINSIIRSWNRKYSAAPKIDRKEISIIDGYVGKGYALSRREELDLIKQAAVTEGVLLDPVYTGKAMYALQDLIASKRFKAFRRILFVHTGGMFGLFPKKNLFF